MAASDSSSASGIDENCLFCKICHGKESLIHDSHDVAVFRDIRPATTHHYLVCPKTHVKNIKLLNRSHIDLVERLVAMGDEALTKHGADLTDVRRGFHWPPFTSINHLHLHVMTPTSQMGWLSRLIFRHNSWWFVSVESLLERLQNMEPEDTAEPAPPLEHS